MSFMKMLKTNRLQAERCEIPKFNSTQFLKKHLSNRLLITDFCVEKKGF